MPHIDARFGGKPASPFPLPFHGPTVSDNEGRREKGYCIADISDVILALTKVMILLRCWPYCVV